MELHHWQWIHALPFLWSREVCATARRVCRTWNRWTRDSTLAWNVDWSHLYTALCDRELKAQLAALQPASAIATTLTAKKPKTPSISSFSSSQPRIRIRFLDVSGCGGFAWSLCDIELLRTRIEWLALEELCWRDAPPHCHSLINDENSHCCTFDKHINSITGVVPGIGNAQAGQDVRMHDFLFHLASTGRLRNLCRLRLGKTWAPHLAFLLGSGVDGQRRLFSISTAHLCAKDQLSRRSNNNDVVTNMCSTSITEAKETTDVSFSKPNDFRKEEHNEKKERKEEEHDTTTKKDYDSHDPLLRFLTVTHARSGDKANMRVVVDWFGINSVDDKHDGDNVGSASVFDANRSDYDGSQENCILFPEKSVISTYTTVTSAAKTTTATTATTTTTTTTTTATATTTTTEMRHSWRLRPRTEREQVDREISTPEERDLVGHVDVDTDLPLVTDINRSCHLGAQLTHFEINGGPSSFIQRLAAEEHGDHTFVRVRIPTYHTDAHLANDTQVEFAIMASLAQFIGYCCPNLQSVSLPTNGVPWLFAPGSNDNMFWPALDASVRSCARCCSLSPASSSSLSFGPSLLSSSDTRLAWGHLCDISDTVQDHTKWDQWNKLDLFVYRKWDDAFLPLIALEPFRNLESVSLSVPLNSNCDDVCSDPLITGTNVLTMLATACVALTSVQLCFVSLPSSAYTVKKQARKYVKWSAPEQHKSLRDLFARLRRLIIKRFPSNVYVDMTSITQWMPDIRCLELPRVGVADWYQFRTELDKLRFLTRLCVRHFMVQKPATAIKKTATAAAVAQHDKANNNDVSGESVPHKCRDYPRQWQRQPRHDSSFLFGSCPRLSHMELCDNNTESAILPPAWVYRGLIGLVSLDLRYLPWDRYILDHLSEVLTHCLQLRHLKIYVREGTMLSSSRFEFDHEDADAKITHSDGTSDEEKSISRQQRRKQHIHDRATKRALHVTQAKLESIRKTTSNNNNSNTRESNHGNLAAGTLLCSSLPVLPLRTLQITSEINSSSEHARLLQCIETFLLDVRYGCRWPCLQEVMLRRPFSDDVVPRLPLHWSLDPRSLTCLKITETCVRYQAITATQQDDELNDGSQCLHLLLDWARNGWTQHLTCLEIHITDMLRCARIDTPQACPKGGLLPSLPSDKVVTAKAVQLFRRTRRRVVLELLRLLLRRDSCLQKLTLHHIHTRYDEDADEIEEEKEEKEDEEEEMKEFTRAVTFLLCQPRLHSLHKLGISDTPFCATQLIQIMAANPKLAQLVGPYTLGHTEGLKVLRWRRRQVASYVSTSRDAISPSSSCQSTPKTDNANSADNKENIHSHDELSFLEWCPGPAFGDAFGVYGDDVDYERAYAHFGRAVVR